jgi:hypothetical protein
MTAPRYASISERITWTTGFHCATDKAVLCALATFADFKTGARARVRRETLSARAGLKLCTVERALHRLERGGWIVAQRRRHRQATEWAINLERLATHWIDASVVESDKVLSRTSAGLEDVSPAPERDREPFSPAPVRDRSPVRTDPLSTRPPARPLEAVPQQLTLNVDRPEAADVWHRVLDRLELKVPRYAFHQWLKGTALVEDAGSVLLVRAARGKGDHEIAALWIQKHFARALAEALAEVRPGARVVFEFAVRREERRQAG